MKLFGFEFKRFNKEKSIVNSVENIEIHRFEEQPTKVEVVELWIVKWYPLRHDFSNRYIIGDLQHLAFTSKASAREYAAQLESALKLLGDKGRQVWVCRQDNPTNV